MLIIDESLSVLRAQFNEAGASRCSHGVRIYRPRSAPTENTTRETPGLTYVTRGTKVTYMEKTQVYLRKEDLDALRKAAARSGRSVAELIRDAIRKVVLKPQAGGPVAIWDGEPRRTSIEHDSVHDET